MSMYLKETRRLNTAICTSETVQSIDLAIPDLATHSRIPTDPSTMDNTRKDPTEEMS